MSATNYRYPARVDATARHRRAVWALGEEGDWGVMVEGHGPRAFAALNGYACEFGLDLTDEKPEEKWVVIHTTCGCTEQQHADHEASGGRCECAYPNLPPCTDPDDCYAGAWYADPVEAGTPDAIPVVMLQW